MSIHAFPKALSLFIERIAHSVLWRSTAWAASATIAPMIASAIELTPTVVISRATIVLPRTASYGALKKIQMPPSTPIVLIAAPDRPAISAAAF